MISSPFEGEALKRLQLAAEEIAFLTGRGYSSAEVTALVVKQRNLSPEQLLVLGRTVCSPPQYMARAVKEMLPEDITRRPLLVDAHDVLDAITTALSGGVLLESLDQTVQALLEGGDPAQVDAALTRIGPVLREMRPSKTKWLLSEKRPDAGALAEKLLAASKKWKVAVEIQTVPDPKSVLRTSANVVTSDPEIIDACRSWCNLAGPVVAKIPGVRRVKLQ